MSWITKQLTLDLLAITIDGLNKVFDRINQEPDNTAPGAPATESVSPWPVDDPAQPVTPTQPTPEPVKNTPEPTHETPTLDPDKLRTEAQTLLRTISQAGGTEWITGTLFPHFNVQTLTNVPADKLPELNQMAEAHLQKEAAA